MRTQLTSKKIPRKRSLRANPQPQIKPIGFIVQNTLDRVTIPTPFLIFLLFIIAFLSGMAATTVYNTHLGLHMAK